MLQSSESVRPKPTSEVPASPPADAPRLAIAPFGREKAKAHQQAWADCLGIPVEDTNSIGMQLRLIPPGEFLMGSSDELIDAAIRSVKRGPHQSVHSIDGVLAEGPQHRVKITRPYYMAAHEVSVGQFRQFTKESNLGIRVDQIAGQSASDDVSVHNVTWREAHDFCEWLEQKEGWTYSLPTEAQWEYGCRAGTVERWHWGDDVVLLASYAWFDAPTTGSPGIRLANPFGLFDMSGNAREWCADWFGHYSNAPQDDPTGPTRGIKRVARGGAFSDEWPGFLRSAVRRGFNPTSRAGNGFRVVRGVPRVNKARVPAAEETPSTSMASPTPATRSAREAPKAKFDDAGSVRPSADRL